MELNLSIYCHKEKQSVLHNESGERLESITLVTPDFIIGDFEKEEVERNSIILSAALLALPERYKRTFQGDTLTITELTEQMLSLEVAFSQDAHVPRYTIEIAYVG